MITQSQLRTIQWLFNQFKEQFGIYDNVAVYDTDYRFEAYDRAESFIELLREQGLYYTIYDEDDTNSYIRPDCYNIKYNQQFQERVERLLQIRFKEEQ